MGQVEQIWDHLLARGYRQWAGDRRQVEVVAVDADESPRFRVRFAYPGEESPELSGTYEQVLTGIAALPVRAGG